MTRASGLMALAFALAEPVPPAPRRAAYVPTKAERKAKEKKRAERKAERKRKTKARRAGR